MSVAGGRRTWTRFVAYGGSVCAFFCGDSLLDHVAAAPCGAHRCKGWSGAALLPWGWTRAAGWGMRGSARGGVGGAAGKRRLGKVGGSERWGRLFPARKLGGHLTAHASTA